MSSSKPVGPYAPVVRAGGWLVVSGQVGLAEGGLVRGGVQAELRQALANLRSLLEAEGASLTDDRRLARAWRSSACTPPQIGRAHV